MDVVCLQEACHNLASETRISGYARYHDVQTTHSLIMYIRSSIQVTETTIQELQTEHQRFNNNKTIWEYNNYQHLYGDKYHKSTGYLVYDPS